MSLESVELQEPLAAVTQRTFFMVRLKNDVEILFKRCNVSHQSGNYLCMAVF